MKATAALAIGAALIVLPSATGYHADDHGVRQAAGRRNVIFILSDDHRYDFMGFHPNALDWLRRQTATTASSMRSTRH